MSIRLDVPLMDDQRRYQSEVYKAWELFMATGSLPEGDFRPTIVNSWKRCKEQNLNPHSFKAPTRRPNLTEVNDHLLTLAPDVVKSAGAGMRLTRHLIAICDAEGVILAVDGDPVVVSRALDVNIARNGVWAEHLVGTNGIGTSLHEVRPVQIFATEHFCAGWQHWTCSAAPVRDPQSGSVVGGVNISSYAAPVHPHTLELTAAIARQLELELHLHGLVRTTALFQEFHTHEAAYPSSAVIAVNTRGRIVAANTWARRLMVGMPKAQLQAAVRAALRNARPLEQELALPDGRRTTCLWHPVRADKHGAGAIVILGLQTASRPSRTSLVQSEWKAWEGTGTRSPQMRDAIELGRKAATVDVPVLITGETGTGKELMARAIHNGSNRARGPFVAVNCGSLAPELVISELFGYEAGAFTGAARTGSPGRFEQADGGTLLLDEVGDLTPQAQVALLRTLESGEVSRIGSQRSRRVDVRTLAATNWDLWSAVQAGRFRRDLYFRLNTLEVALPPLRERKEDIPTLVQFFLTQASQTDLTISDEAMAALINYNWPGNVRELRSAVQRALLLQQGGLVRPEHLVLPKSVPVSVGVSDWEENKRRAVLAELDAARGNVAHTARRLGISRNTVYKYMNRPLG